MNMFFVFCNFQHSILLYSYQNKQFIYFYDRNCDDIGSNHNRKYVFCLVMLKCPCLHSLCICMWRLCLVLWHYFLCTLSILSTINLVLSIPHSTPVALLQLMKLPTIIIVPSPSSKFNTLFNYSIMESVLLNLTSEFKPSLLRHILACLRWSYIWHLSAHCPMHTSVWLHTIFISFSMYT